MTNHLIGQTAALLAAITWAVAVVLFKRSGERVPPIALNLYKNAVALILLGLTLGLLILVDPSHGLAEVREFPPGDFCILMASGVLGIAVADTLFFYALNLIGVGLISIVDCCYSPCVLALAWLLLSETISAPHYVGGALILLGIFIASGHRPPEGRTRGQLLAGIALAVLAISLMAFGVVIAKPILEKMAVIWSTTIRLAAGAIMLALFALIGPARQAHWSVFRPSAGWKAALPASILGTYFSLVFWIAGFKYTYASVAAVLNQTSVIFAIILAGIFLKEPFGKRKAAAVALALTGVAIVTLAERMQSAWHQLRTAVAAWGGW